jgi:fumarate reductase flavoprotein subunit
VNLSIQNGLPGDANTVATSVAIVGGGACGLTAALVLKTLGIDCVVIERDRLPRGSTALSSGLIPACVTNAQTAAGIDDDPEVFKADIQAKAKGNAAPHLVNAYVNAIGPAVDLLEKDYGLAWQVLDGFLYPGHNRYRMHTVAAKTGVGLMDCLIAAAQKADVTILTDARVTELWTVSTADDELTGLTFCRPNGSVDYLRAEFVLLACNGFGGNSAMVKEFIPEISEAQFGGHAGNDGSAIEWGRQLRAVFKDMNAYQGHGSWAVPHACLISWAIMMQGGIQVNQRGERFHDETEGYSEAAVQVLAQPGGIAWNVFDEPLLALARSFPDFVEAEKSGAVKQALSIEALAILIGCEPSVLAKTLSNLTGRIDRQWTAPFYAVKVTGALFHTQGGLNIDEGCRVIKDHLTSDETQTTFKNLLAAGGAARGVSGNAVWGYLSGNGLLSAVAGGYIAAQTVKRSIDQPHQI